MDGGLEDKEISSDECCGEISENEIEDILAMDGDVEELGDVVVSQDYIPAPVDPIFDDSDSDDEIGVVYEHIEQLSKLSVTKNDTSSVTVTLKYTPGGIKSVATDGVAGPSKRPRRSSKKVSRQRKRLKRDECDHCKTGMSEAWFIHTSEKPCCPNGYQ